MSDKYTHQPLTVGMDTYNGARDLAHILIMDNHPAEVVRGLRSIAEALIQRPGFELRFKAFVIEAECFAKNSFQPFYDKLNKEPTPLRLTAGE